MAWSMNFEYDAQHDVVTYRCKRCGYLESYA